MNMSQKLQQHEDEIRELRMQGIKMKDLATRYGVTYNTMTHFLTTHRIVLKPKTINDDIINNIVNEYVNGKRYDKIAYDYHMDKETVRNIIIQSGNKIREKSDAFQVYTINQHYFDEINTPEKAYILGLLYTDGNRNKREGHYQITLKLQDRDVDILYKIQQLMNYNRPLKFIEKIKEHPTHRNQYALIIDNKQIAVSLERWGIIPNKTEYVTFPSFLNNELIPHFLRGCWDGDGTISHNPKEQRTSLIGTYALVSKIKEFLEDKLHVHFTLRKAGCKMESIYTISLHGRLQLKTFLDYLYNNSTIHFDRKYSYYRFMCYGDKLNSSLST